MPRPDEYQVEGYGVRTEGYDAPYHPAADFDPAEDFKFAGDPKKQEKHQREVLGKRKRPSQFKSPRETEKRVSDLTASNVPVADTGTDVREDSQSGVKSKNEDGEKGSAKLAPSTADASKRPQPAKKSTSSSKPKKKATKKTASSAKK